MSAGHLTFPLVHRRQNGPDETKSQTRQSFLPTARGHLQSRPASSARSAQVNGARHSRPNVPGGVCDHAIETVAVLPRASILPEEAAAVAPLAVLAVLAGAVLADLAVGNGGVLFGRALAAVADRRLDHEPAAAAREWLGAAALELADPGRGEPRRARRNTGTVQKIPAITADLTSTAAHIHKHTAYRQGKFGEVEPPCCVAKCQLRLLGASRGGDACMSRRTICRALQLPSARVKISWDSSSTQEGSRGTVVRASRRAKRAIGAHSHTP